MFLTSKWFPQRAFSLYKKKKYSEHEILKPPSEQCISALESYKTCKENTILQTLQQVGLNSNLSYIDYFDFSLRLNNSFYISQNGDFTPLSALLLSRPFPSFLSAAVAQISSCKHSRTEPRPFIQSPQQRAHKHKYMCSSAQLQRVWLCTDISGAEDWLIWGCRQSQLGLKLNNTDESIQKQQLPSKSLTGFYILSVW